MSNEDERDYQEEAYWRNHCWECDSTPCQCVVPSDREIKQSTHIWEGPPPTLALVLQRELGVTEEVVPSTARYMQITGIHDVDGTSSVNVLVTFYTKNFDTIECDKKDEEVVGNFVL